MAHELVENLKKPPRRLYMRVNTLKASRESVIDLLRRENIVAYPDEFLPDAIYVYVEGPFRIDCDTDKRIVVDEKTAISLMMGANLYRPGVLKFDPFKKNEKLLVLTREGDSVSCIQAQVSHDQVLKMAKGLIGINVSSPFRAPSIADTSPYAMGLIYPQSLPSIATVHALQPRPGELIVDMNASPGGKTSHIVQLTRGSARLVSIDRSEPKINQLRKNLSKLGLDLNVLALPMDSRYIHVDLNLQGRVDRVLVDPPCSNLGVRPVIRFHRTMRDVEDLSNYQKQFIKTAYQVLRPGGILVYSTCTITLRENEENLLYAVEELGFHSVELDEPPPYSTKVMYRGVVGYRYSPLHMDMPGYFIAVLAK